MAAIEPINFDEVGTDRKVQGDRCQATGARQGDVQKRYRLCTAGWTFVGEYWKIEVAVFLPLLLHHHHHP